MNKIRKIICRFQKLLVTLQRKLKRTMVSQSSLMAQIREKIKGNRNMNDVAVSVRNILGLANRPDVFTSLSTAESYAKGKWKSGGAHGISILTFSEVPNVYFVAADNREEAAMVRAGFVRHSSPLHTKA